MRNWAFNFSLHMPLLVIAINELQNESEGGFVTEPYEGSEIFHCKIPMFSFKIVCYR